MESRHRVIDGIRMRWEEEGEGFPVVLLHGIPTSPALWRSVMPLLGGSRRLAWEMVGYGDSMVEGRGRDISLWAQAGYLTAWMRDLGIDRAVLVGHDLGGGVAQIAAVRDPDLCAGLVLTNSVGYDSWPIPSVKALRAAAGIVERLPASALTPVFATFMIRGHDDARRAREGLRLHRKPYADAAGPEGFAAQLRSLDVRDTLRVAPRLTDLGVPASIVWGASDRFQKVRYGQRLARDLRAELRRIPEGKHFTPEDHPQDVAEAVHAVLRRIRTRGAA